MNNKLLSTTLVSGILALSASADILVTNVTNDRIATDGFGNFSFTYDVINPDSVVVAGFYFDNSAGVASSVTLDGNASDGGILTAGRTSTAYFLNPTAGTLSFNGTNSDGGSTGQGGYVIYELAGVDLGISPVSTTGRDNALNITTTLDNSFIIDFATVNDGLGVGTSSPDANSVLTLNADQDGAGPGGGWILGGSAIASTAGTYELGWTTTSTSSYAEIAYAFTAIPEPSAIALTSGFVGLALVALRRRR